MEVETLSKTMTEVETRSPVDVLADRQEERELDTLNKTLAKVKLCTSD